MKYLIAFSQQVYGSILIIAHFHRYTNEVFINTKKAINFFCRSLSLAYLQNCIYDVLLPSGQTLTRLVAVSSTCYHAPTSALSTSSSPRGFPCLAASGYLISGEASRLDAFSAYPLPARLPGGAPGGAAGTPAASPPRSSRTRGGSLQISCARTG